MDIDVELPGVCLPLQQPQVVLPTPAGAPPCPLSHLRACPGPAKAGHVGPTLPSADVPVSVPAGNTSPHADLPLSINSQATEMSHHFQACWNSNQPLFGRFAIALPQQRGNAVMQQPLEKHHREWAESLWVPPALGSVHVAHRNHRPKMHCHHNRQNKEWKFTKLSQKNHQFKRRNRNQRCTCQTYSSHARSVMCAQDPSSCVAILQTFLLRSAAAVRQSTLIGSEQSV